MKVIEDIFPAAMAYTTIKKAVMSMIHTIWAVRLFTELLKNSTDISLQRFMNCIREHVITKQEELRSNFTGRHTGTSFTITCT